MFYYSGTLSRIVHKSKDIEIINSLSTSINVNNNFITSTANYRDVYYKINGTVTHIRTLNSKENISYINLSTGKEIQQENIYSVNYISK